MTNSYNNYPAWTNGNFCQVKDLSVSVFDLGLVYADATYDVMAFRNYQGIRVNEHIDRFLNSCKCLRIPIDYTHDQLMNVVAQVHGQTGWPDSIIWLSATRGVPTSGNPRDLLSCQPSVVCYAKPYYKFNGTNQATVCSADTAVRVPDICIDQTHKNFARIDLTRAQWEAIDRGFTTAIVFGTQGYLSEGPGFNVAIVKDNTVLAPRTNCLPGISMLLVEEACCNNNIKFLWADIDKPTVDQCDDMFLTTTVGNVVTVTNYNGRLLSMSSIQQRLIELINN
jgi:branched-chain amino acid aminotransferase